MIYVKKASILEDWFTGLCSSVEDVQDKSIADRKKTMISSAIESLIEVYKEKQQYAVAQKFEELKNNIWRWSCKKRMVHIMICFQAYQSIGGKERPREPNEWNLGNRSSPVERIFFNKAMYGWINYTNDKRARGSSFSVMMINTVYIERC